MKRTHFEERRTGLRQNHATRSAHVRAEGNPTYTGSEDEGRGSLFGRTSIVGGLLAALTAAAFLAEPAHATGFAAKSGSRSTSIALSRGGDLLVNANREADSVTLFEVRGSKSKGPLKKLAEVPVGHEPTCVAIHPHGHYAYVTNAGSSTVSVIKLQDEKAKVVKEIAVGTEPEGCALTPSGDWLYVANLTAGTVSVIDTGFGKVVETIPVGGRPAAVAISDDGDRRDRDETVFVTQFFAELIPNGPGEGFDDGKQGRVQAIRVGQHAAIKDITLAPLANSGFTANRKNFCPQSAATPPVNTTFCPDLTAPPGSDAIEKDPQAVHPNQLNAALVCGSRLFLPNIGAQPEPPVVFNANVQALVHVVDAAAGKELVNSHVNLNAQVAREAEPASPAGSLQRAFLNDIVAIDADAKCENFAIVSRGGSFVIKARVVNGKLDIGAPDKVVRLATGNIPTGIAISRNGKQAFVNNEIGQSVSVLDLANNTVVARDVSSTLPPKPGSHEHAVLMGQLVFFTAMGVPDNGLVGQKIRDIDTIQFRGKQSADAWSTCASCHPRGLADGVTWLFADGPRQTIPLDGLYSKINGAHDIRINNWSAVRDGMYDFNNNSRNVQCGAGFAGGDPQGLLGECPFKGDGKPSAAIFDHGVAQGVSEALDFEVEWAMTVRPLNQPKSIYDPQVVAAGADVFSNNCASCHGGAKWTKSQVVYLNNPALDKDANAGGKFRDPGLAGRTNGDQIISYVDALVEPGNEIKFLENIGTFDPNNPIEIRGQAAQGARALGELGFNVPSLLSVAFHAPYFHDGAAQTLDDVFRLHQLGGGTIESTLSGGDRSNLLVFLQTLDGRTPLFQSDTDKFKDPSKSL